MAKTILYVLGVVLTLVGILGFFNDPVLGYFEVDALHNIIHIASGVVFLAVAAFAAGSVRLVAQIFGVVYAAVAIVGLVMPGDMILGIFEANFADDILHVLLALVLLYAGFMTKKEMGSAPMGGMPMNQGGTM